MWEMCPISEPGKPFVVQMVLIDAEGQRIEATIRKSLIKKLFGEIVEGNIYKITYLHSPTSPGPTNPSTQPPPTWRSSIPTFLTPSRSLKESLDQAIQRDDVKAIALTDLILPLSWK